MRKQNLILAVLILLGVMFNSCQKPKEVFAAPRFIVKPFSKTMDENPKNGMELGRLWVVTTYYTPKITVLDSSKSPIYINEFTGEMTVRDSRQFDYEKNKTLELEIKIQVLDTVTFTKVYFHLKDRAEVNASIQDRIYAGETPFEIYQSDHTLLDSLYGAYYKEGYFFHLDTLTGQGVICAEEDYVSAYWGCGKYCSTEEEIGTGKSNLEKISTTCPNANIVSYALNYTRGGHTDWFVPSLDALRKMSAVLHDRGIGNFKDERYWTSSQFKTSGYNIYYVAFGSNGFYSYESTSAFYILRMVRFVN